MYMYTIYPKSSSVAQRGCIVAKLVARMMGRAGISHVLTVDLHTKEVRSALCRSHFLHRTALHCTVISSSLVARAWPLALH